MWQDAWPLLGGLQTQTSMNGLVGPPDVKYRITSWPSKSSPKSDPKRIESRDSNRYTDTRVHSSTVLNGQKMETAQVSAQRMMDKQKCGSDHTTHYYPVIKKEWSSDMRKWNKPDTKRQTLYDFTYVRYREQADSETESRREVSRGWWGTGNHCLWGTEFLCEVISKF